MSYILPGARASYRNWWAVHSSTIELWFAYRHLNIPSLGYIPRVPRKWKSCRGWVRPWTINKSGESRFVQNGYAKKEPDQARLDWRERKGFRRDQAKNNHRDGCPPWLKRVCNKEYRQWSRALIQKGRDAEIGTKIRKDYFDSWRWN